MRVEICSVAWDATWRGLVVCVTGSKSDWHCRDPQHPNLCECQPGRVLFENKSAPSLWGLCRMDRSEDGLWQLRPFAFSVTPSFPCTSRYWLTCWSKSGFLGLICAKIKFYCPLTYEGKGLQPSLIHPPTASKSPCDIRRWVWHLS